MSSNHITNNNWVYIAFSVLSLRAVPQATVFAADRLRAAARSYHAIAVGWMVAVAMVFL